MEGSLQGEDSAAFPLEAPVASSPFVTGDLSQKFRLEGAGVEGADVDRPHVGGAPSERLVTVVADAAAGTVALAAALGGRVRHWRHGGGKACGKKITNRLVIILGITMLLACAFNVFVKRQRQQFGIIILALKEHCFEELNWFCILTFWLQSITVVETWPQCSWRTHRVKPLSPPPRPPLRPRPTARRASLAALPSPWPGAGPPHGG